METISTKSPALILSGTGKIGRRVASLLSAKAVPIRIGSRNSDIPFDWTNPGTWEAALNGVRAVYIAYHSDLAFPGALDHITTLVRQAVDTGVQQLVLLSGRGEPAAALCEQAVQRCGAAWTIVRASWFNQNFSESFFQPQIVDGYVPFVSRGAKEPFVDADDLAEMAAAALSNRQHDGQIYEITGPRLLTFEDAVGEIARATGSTISYEEMTRDCYLALLLANGLPHEVAEPLVDLFTNVLDGRNASLSDGLQRALGREPQDFRNFAQRAAAVGAWKRHGL